MNFNNFISEIASIMDINVSQLSSEKKLKDYPEWDSLCELSLISMVEDGFGYVPNVEMIREEISIAALYEKIFSGVK